MAIEGAHQRGVEHAGSLLEIARLIAREVPDEILFATVSEHAALRVGVEAASVLRFVGDERAVVIGVWREGGRRGLPVNAELDFDRRNSALGRVRSTRRPARADSYEGHGGELPLVMRAVDIRASVAAPILHEGEVWGALAASTTRDEPLPAGTEERLADFAELVAQAVANAASRRREAASRRRVVEASDEARRRLERVLHEGTQQHLLALTLKLRIAHGRAEPGSDIAGLLEDALAEAAVANAELRDLARGLYPIVLTERGLAAALQALTARSAVPVHLLELPSRRFPRLAEATAYFVVAEAIAAAPPDATDVAVMVGDRGDRLVVEVRTGSEAHLPGLADRIAAVGGVVHSDPGDFVRVDLPIER